MLKPLLSTLAAIAATLGVAGPTAHAQADEPINVLFVAVDDLKPLIGAYGDPHAVTPNFDRLAARGVTFTNAHCQQAVCAPSRVSLMLGLRPDTTRVFDLQTQFRPILPDAVTIGERFQQAGYASVGMGKIFDPRSAGGRNSMDAQSWSEPFINVSVPNDNTFSYRNPEVVARVAAIREAAGDGWPRQYTRQLELAFPDKRPPTDRADVPDNAYHDGAMTDLAVERLQGFADSGEAFFLAVGFKKPHLPFNAPERYWQMYDPDAFALATLTDAPDGAPGYATQPGWELRSGYNAPPEGLIPVEMQRDLIHGYYACVSYIDAQLGRLLDTLDETGLADNTVVVVWGDHGFHLGDHSIWCKHTNFEQATRVPLIFAGPGVASAGAASHAPVEVLDVYPTLLDLAGLDPAGELHGVSLRPIFDDPTASVKPAAVSQYPRGHRGDQLMGYAYRTERYRLVQWRQMDAKAGDTTGPIVAVELYDYETDPHETRNLADDPAYADVRAELEAVAESLGSGAATVEAYADTDPAKGVATKNDDDETGTTDAAPVVGGVIEVDPSTLPVLGDWPHRWREADELPVYHASPQGELKLHIFLPPDADANDGPRGALILFHGGGWNSGQPRAFYNHAIYFADQGIPVFCPEYRTAETHETRVADCVADAAAAVRYVRANAARWDIDPDRIAVGGGSAGGHLALTTALLEREPAPGDEHADISARPNALVLFNPVLDTARFGPARMGDDGEALSPRHHLHADAPPMLLFNGTADETTGIATAREAVDELHDLGVAATLVAYEGETHAFFYRGKNEGRCFLDSITRATHFLAAQGVLPTP